MTVTDILCTECDRPVGDGLTLCTVCGERLVAELLGVPGLLADLQTARAGQARIATGREGGRSAEAPLPIKDTTNEERGRGLHLLGDQPALALQTALHGWARVLAEHLAVEIPIDSRALVVLATNARIFRRGTIDAPFIVHNDKVRHGKRVREARIGHRSAAHLTTPTQEVERLAMWLACHPHELRGLEAAREMLTDITGACAALRRAIDRPADLLPLGPCSAELADGSSCGYELRADREATWVRCRRCRSQHEVRELQRKAADGIEDQLYTLPQLRRILPALGTPVGKTTLYRWAQERRIEPRGWQHGNRITDHQISDDDRQVYRLGDVRALARRDEGDTMTGTFTTVIWHDRHSGTYPYLFTDRAVAEAWAREQAREYDRHGDYSEETYPDGELRITYSSENDRLRVIDVVADAEVLKEGSAA
ncbi:hypothetical protein ACFXG4_27255 [Nocardia sp. NPDC059246]|uniref:hypothetical protein n=1 Tax=unclassified Nocardia TaxID=2637762 RepID=UPI0036A2038A